MQNVVKSYDKALINKLLFRMKLSLFILTLQLTFTGILLAATASSQDLGKVKVKLDLKNAGLAESLLILQNKSGIKFFFYEQLFDKEAKKVTLHSAAISVSDALKIILNNTNLRYKPFNDFVVIESKSVPVNPGKISGQVLDEKGETLPGATVKAVEKGTGTQASVDGAYTLNLDPGTYTLEISFVSFQTQRITGVVVEDSKITLLDISMKPAASGLQEVIVTASYHKASLEGLLARQKNASEISNGISADQLARTPDKNVGESLKRISGVSTIDNKFVLVRGIGERYNSAMLDGVLLPSTEAQSRSFSFDMIPSNLVDNVLVSKTVTPDMNASFGGGLIQINTKDIPNENFMSFTAGSSINDQTTGKDFLSHKRGKIDYLGFDDGRRDFPELVHTDRNVAPNIDLSQEAFEKKVIDQSRKFTKDNFTMYKYNGVPSQNYQFNIGHLFSLDTASNNTFGFTGSLSYRNTQNINLITNQTRSDWYDDSNNTGASYGFNTTLGGLLNAGLQVGKNRFSFRNTYTHVYDNTLVRIIGYDIDNAPFLQRNIPNRTQEADDPTYTDLLQNKLNGQHHINNVKIEWAVARTSISRQEKDLVIATSGPVIIGSDYQYVYGPGKSTDAQIQPTSRHRYQNKEQHYSWDISATIPFTLGQIRNSLKTGYFGIHKKADFTWRIAAFVSNTLLADSLKYIPVGEMVMPENIAFNKYYFISSSLWADAYEGKSITHAGYIMLDSRILDKLRLVWGIRGEYYNYTEIRNANNENLNQYVSKPEPKWQWLPSINLTYSPAARLNVRAAFSSSVVRPELMENSRFLRYSPYLGAQFSSSGIFSTRINSFDIKTELFPGLGEVISAGAFYKKFNKPAELTFSNKNYLLRSAEWAMVYGLELELRKSLSFIAENNFLKNIAVYSNLTLQRSEVRSTYQITNPDPEGPPLDVITQQKRPMYGQTPYLFNAGLQYTASHFGLNAIYNKSGYKTYIVGDRPTIVEFEKGREQLDVQVSCQLLKRRLEVKLNGGNLFNSASIFYNNVNSYEINPDSNNNDNDISDAYRLKSGFSNNFEDGDLIVFKQKFGRTYSTSITWNF